MRYFFICVRDWWRARREAPVEAVDDAPLPDPLLDEFNALERLVEARKEQERLDAMTPEQRAVYDELLRTRYDSYAGRLWYGDYNSYANQYNQLDAMQYQRSMNQDVYGQYAAQFGLANVGNPYQRGLDG